MEFIKKPVAKYGHVDGNIVSMYIKVREGKAVRAIRPNPTVLVYFYLGRDDLPVGIKFLEPVAGVAVTEAVTKLCTTPEGAPLGVDGECNHSFMPCSNEFLEVMLHGMKKLSPQIVLA